MTTVIACTAAYIRLRVKQGPWWGCGWSSTRECRTCMYCHSQWIARQTGPCWGCGWRSTAQKGGQRGGAGGTRALPLHLLWVLRYLACTQLGTFCKQLKMQAWWRTVESRIVTGTRQTIGEQTDHYSCGGRFISGKIMEARQAVRARR